MAMRKIDFKNLPNTETPISNTNLNQMQDNAEDYVDETKTSLQTNINTVNTNLTADITKVLTALGLNVDTYSSSSTYAVGDMVVYNNTIYECTTAISTAEEWNSSKWTIVPIIVNE